MILGTHPVFSAGRSLFHLDDLFAIRSRIIGSGQIGGKAAGMLLARQILLHDDRERFARILENHDSFYIGSDVFFTFLVDNNLFRQRLQLCRGSQISDEEFHEIEHRFLAGKFPRDHGSVSEHAGVFPGSRPSSFVPAVFWKTVSAMPSPANTAANSV